MATIRSRVGVVALGILAIGLTVLALVSPTDSSKAQQGTMHNCPPAGKWAIAVWEGTNGTAASDALTTCGQDAVAAAYSLDPQTGGWWRWFAGRPEASNLPPLSNMQGVLALGGTEAAATGAEPPIAAEAGQLQSCPAAGKWSIAVWAGQNGTDAPNALATCGAGAVDAAYSLDAQTGAWSRWFAGKPEVSNLPPLTQMQGVIALGANMAPAEQQEIVVQSGQPEFFDPHRSNFEQDIAIARMLWRGLYQLESTADGSVRPVPAMADGEPTVNSNVYTVKLKPNLKWSDGVPMTAKDFVYGVQRECDPDTASPYQYVLGASILGIVGCDEFFGIKGTTDAPKTPTEAEIQAARDAVGIKAIDDTTVEVTLIAPKPTFTTVMSLWAAFPARQDVIEQFGDKWTDPGNIVTNGPFILTQLTAGAGGEVVLEPNPNWALEPKPALKRITIKFIDDLETAFRSFQNGELDITNIPAAEIPTIRADSALSKEFLQVGATRIWSVQMQMNNPVLGGTGIGSKGYNLRLALSRAIDRDALVKAVYSDAYLPATYWLVQGLPGFQGNAPFEDKIGYDPQAAKEALADAGYPNGQGFPTLTLTVLGRPDRNAEGEFLQNAWKDILGINVETEAVDAKTRSSTFNSESFDLFMGGWQNDYPDPENSLIGLFDTGGGNNHYNCSDPEIDAKLKAASTETDNATRIKDLQEAETLIVTKLCGVAPIWQSSFLYLVDSNVGGVNPNGQIDAAMPGNWCPECWFVKAQP